MDDPLPAGQDPPGEPDPEAVAALRALLPEDLEHLPVTSAAEFRREAWKAHHVRAVPSGSYHPRIGFRGFLAACTGLFALGGVWMLFTGQMLRGDVLENVLLWVFLIVATVLLGWSRWSSNRTADRLVERNQVLSRLSARVGREVEAGRIPLMPPGWEGEISAPL